MISFLQNILIRVVTWLLIKLIGNAEWDEYTVLSSIRPKQVVFLQNIAKLIEYSKKLPGYELTAGEMYRTAEQQAIYLKKGLSKRKVSQHQNRLAFDINVFINGQYRTDKEAYKPLAEYWKKLHPDNRSGYYWDWDYNHFEMS